MITKDARWEHMFAAVEVVLTLGALTLTCCRTHSEAVLSLRQALTQVEEDILVFQAA